MNNLKDFINTKFFQPCMAGEFLPITKDVAWSKNFV